MLPWAHPTPQPKQHVNQFSRFCTAHCKVLIYFTLGCPWQDLELTGVFNPNSTSFDSAIFAWLTTVTDWLTDHTTRSATIGRIYSVSKKRPTFGLLQLWYKWTDFDIFFDRNATDKVRNQKTFYYATSNNLCFCTMWQNGKHENCIFHLLY